ncbi:MAG TPA: ribonuclease HII [Candidatus Thermoplasmatota archaeon]|nr:ribonuclease HII [Candidatus Thermoplasmatota archaeon]
MLGEQGEPPKRLAGVDEAGRGPVLGPLVVAAVLVENERKLKRLGVKDSKLLSAKRREELEPEIRKLATQVEVRVIPPEELNARMPGQNLNEIEVEAFAELLERLAPTVAYVDACDVVAERFGRNVAARVTHVCAIHAEHEADARHPIVAAASIVAKVERDRRIAELQNAHGELGSGYSHDVVTQRWLADYVKANRRLPPFARREWETSRRLMQRDLTEFLGPAPPPAPPAQAAKPKKAAAGSRRK